MLSDKFVGVTETYYGDMFYWGTDFVIGSALAAYGEWFESEVDVFRFYVHDGDAVADCGTNVGYHTLALASLVGKDGLVLAVEPQRPMFQLMCANAITNGNLNVHPVLAALSHSEGYTRFDTPDYTKINTFGGFRTTEEAVVQSGTATRVERLDQLWFSLFEKPISFIKIDVEGSEPDVIIGASELIKRDRPVMYIENDRKENSARLMNLLLAQEYDLYWHIPRFYNPNNLNGRADDLLIHRYFWDKHTVNGASIMLLCLPREKQFPLPKIPHLKQVASIDEYPPFEGM